tara:strand:- start:4343 stop:4453 length:111 start_codon:yes stop_codon:yes gene_type:complete
MIIIIYNKNKKKEENGKNQPFNHPLITLVKGYYNID